MRCYHVLLICVLRLCFCVLPFAVSYGMVLYDDVGNAHLLSVVEHLLETAPGVDVVPAGHPGVREDACHAHVVVRRVPFARIVLATVAIPIRPRIVDAAGADVDHHLLGLGRHDCGFELVSKS